jgi:hypothetical protein
MTRNNIIRAVASSDPARLRSRTVEPAKGKGRKRRPRQKAVEAAESEGGMSPCLIIGPSRDPSAPEPVYVSDVDALAAVMSWTLDDEERERVRRMFFEPEVLVLPMKTDEPQESGGVGLRED